MSATRVLGLPSVAHLDWSTPTIEVLLEVSVEHHQHIQMVLHNDDALALKRPDAQFFHVNEDNLVT
jgi:hypothetical protein